MKKIEPKGNFMLKMGVVTILSLLTYALLHYTEVLYLPEKQLALVFIMTILLMLLGALIITIGKFQHPESFGQRFIILTTAQMMMFLAIVAAARYALGEEAKDFILQFLFVFITLLIFQSLFLVQFGKHLINEHF